MKKQLPKLKSDEDVERLLDTDLSDYLTPENLTAVSFEIEPKEKVVNLRRSAGLLGRIKRAALQKKCRIRSLFANPSKSPSKNDWSLDYRTARPSLKCSSR